MQPIVRTLNCGGVPVDMQVDTETPVPVITYKQNKTVWPKLRGSPLKLTCFLGRLFVRGQLNLKVSCGNRSTDGSLTVLGCYGPSLCGRNLIQAFNMLQAPVMNVNTTVCKRRRYLFLRLKTFDMGEIAESRYASLVLKSLTETSGALVTCQVLEFFPLDRWCIEAL
ncbi:uncharacterized protein [Dermacentor andersoni]|uniref:uncharacterized protein n=1 Tax=Dermacentor andersoni TaxID=34620 RepID=UPI003B3AA407